MKKIISRLVLVVLALSLTTFCAKDKSLSERIIGKWKMTMVLELSLDVTSKHNPDNDRWIRFIDDPEIENGGKFESGKGDSTENTGKWFIDKDVLFIDSDAGKDDDSYWQITINDDEMRWKGRKFEFNKRFEIFHKKVE